MTNPLKRGSAPGRERPDYQRPGTFKRGHKKRGGRKRGTPNAFSADYKGAIIEAAYRIGYDGNGKDGVIGYLKWVGTKHPDVFYEVLLTSLLPLESAEDYTTEELQWTTKEEINKEVRHYIGLDRNERTKRENVRTELPSPWDWTGQEFPLNSLMHLAVVNPKAFCKLIIAGFLRAPSKLQRGLAARRAWERRQQGAGK